MALNNSNLFNASMWVCGAMKQVKLLLFDYVQQDILGQLPAPLLDFLLQTAILPRMNAAICHAVIAGHSLQASQEMLLEVERANQHPYIF